MTKSVPKAFGPKFNFVKLPSRLENRLAMRKQIQVNLISDFSGRFGKSMKQRNQVKKPTSLINLSN